MVQSLGLIGVCGVGFRVRVWGLGLRQFLNRLQFWHVIMSVIVVPLRTYNFKIGHKYTLLHNSLQVHNPHARIKPPKN